MWIKRDITEQLTKNRANHIQILVGPRQCGKSSLLSFVAGNQSVEITFDDLQMRHLANKDPSLFLSQYAKHSLIIDEVQYAPNIFPELKKIIDTLKKQQLFSKNVEKHNKNKTMFRLTGSNEILLDKHTKESLSGRASYFYMNTLSVNEILTAFPDESMTNIMFRGGWPEIYTNRDISIIQYLNDYIRTYLEKDIVLSAGIQKQHEFNTFLGMLAARSGEILNCSALANSVGVKSVTISEWISILERTYLVYLLKPYANNLNKRLSKSPKLYFLDTGLATRLQGWQELAPFMNSPQAGHMFETLVLSEIIKFKYNFAKDWNVFMWHTKDGEEIDFLLQNAKGDVLALDAKLGIHGVSAIALPSSLKKQFPKLKQLLLVSFGGNIIKLSDSCLQMPITKLADYLKSFD